MSHDGYRQVERLRDRLENEKIDLVYSSDLKRALVTAEVICSWQRTAIITCPELREINYGQAEGLTFDEIVEQHPDVAELIRNFNLALKFPGGESFEGFIERTGKFLDQLDLNEDAPEKTVLIVSHSGPLRVLVCHLLGISQTCWWQLRFDNASLSTVGLYSRGAILTLLNDTSHLREGV
jgi:broad specificity phosphatase PhoE